MGLMDKLKSVKSSITGDWATVIVRADPVDRGGSLEVTADVTVKGQDIGTEGIVLEVRCEEIIDIPNATVHDDVFGNDDDRGNRATGRATSSETLFEQKVTAAGPQHLAAGSATTVTGSIPIPATAPPAFDGRYARYEWQVRARVDMKGNDPDSGWQAIQVG